MDSDFMLKAEDHARDGRALLGDVDWLDWYWFLINHLLMESLMLSHFGEKTQRADYQQTQRSEETLLNIHAGVMNILTVIISEQLN